MFVLVVYHTSWANEPMSMDGAVITLLHEISEEDVSVQLCVNMLRELHNPPCERMHSRKNTTRAYRGAFRALKGSQSKVVMRISIVDDKKRSINTFNKFSLANGAVTCSEKALLQIVAKQHSSH